MVDFLEMPPLGDLYGLSLIFLALPLGDLFGLSLIFLALPLGDLFGLALILRPRDSRSGLSLSISSTLIWVGAVYGFSFVSPHSSESSSNKASLCWVLA